MTKEFCKPVFYRDAKNGAVIILVALAIVFIPTPIGNYFLQDDEFRYNYCGDDCDPGTPWFLGIFLLACLGIMLASICLFIKEAYKRWWIPPEECK